MENQSNKNKNLELLHQQLVKDNYAVPADYAQFERTFSDPANAKLLFDQLSKDRYAIPPDYDSFTSTFGLKKKDASDYGLPTEQVFKDIFSTISKENEISKIPDEYNKPEQVDYEKRFSVPKSSFDISQESPFPQTLGENLIGQVASKSYHNHYDKEKFKEYAQKRLGEIDKELEGVKEYAPKIVPGAPAYTIYATGEEAEGAKKREALLREKDELRSATSDPKKMDFIMGRAMNSALVGMANKIYAGAVTGKDNLPYQLDPNWYENYDENWKESLAGSLIALTLDNPLFSAFGVPGKAIGKAGGNYLSKKLMTQTVDKLVKAKVPLDVAQKLAQKGASKIVNALPSAGASATALGGYEGVGNFLSQWVDPEKDLKDIDYGEVLSSTGRGLALGIGTGLVGIGSSALAQKARQIPNALGRLGTQAGIQAGGLTAESAVFVAGGAMLDGRKLKDITTEEFAETMALLASMKISHAIQDPKMTARGIRQSMSYDPQKPGEGQFKVDIQPWEIEAVGGKDYTSLMKELSKDSEKLGTVMTDENIPAYLKQKLLWGSRGVAMENTSIMAGRIENNGEFVDLYNKEDVLVDRRKFNTKEEAEQWGMSAGIQLEDNKMQMNSAMPEVDRAKLLMDYKQKGGDVNKLLTALDKPAIERTPEEWKMVGDWYAMVPKPKESEKPTEEIKTEEAEKTEILEAGKTGIEPEIKPEIRPEVTKPPVKRPVSIFSKGTIVQDKAGQQFEVVAPRDKTSGQTKMKNLKTKEIVDFDPESTEFTPVQREIKAKGARKGFSGRRFKEGSRSANALKQEPNDLEDAVLQFFIQGGRLKATDFARETGFAKTEMIGGKERIVKGSQGAEWKKYFQLLANEGTSIDDFINNLSETIKISDQRDVREEFIRLMTANNSVGKMLSAYEKKYGAKEMPEPTEEEMISSREDEMSPSEVESEAPALADEVLKIVESEEVNKLLKSERYEDEQGNINWAGLKKLAEENPEHFTEFPWEMTKEEFENFKKLLDDTEKQRSIEELSKEPGASEVEGKGDNLPGGVSKAEGQPEEKGGAEPEKPVKAVRFYDALKQNNAPRIRVQDAQGRERVVWDNGARDYYDTSDETGQKIRWGVELSDGRKVSLDGLIRITQPDVWERWSHRIKGMKLANKNEFVIGRAMDQDSFNQLLEETLNFLEGEDVFTQTFRGRDDKGDKKYSIDPDIIKINKVLREAGHPLADIFGRTIKLNDGTEVNPFGRWLFDIDSRKRKVPIEEPQEQLSPEQQTKIDAINKEYEPKIADLQKSLDKMDDAARNKVQQDAEAEVNRRNTIFGDADAVKGGVLKPGEQGFEVTNKPVQEALRKFDERKVELQKEIDALNKERDSKIGEVKKQMDLFAEKPIEKPQEEVKKEEKPEPSQDKYADIRPTAEDLPYKLAFEAYRNMSFDPEKRAEREQKDYMDSVNSLIDEVSKIATTPEQEAVLRAEIEKYKKGLASKTEAYLSASSRTASPMITGPANFPTERNRKAMETVDKRRTELLEWDAKARASVKKAVLDARSSEQYQFDKWKSIKKELDSNIATITGIDRGEVKGYNRALFVSSMKGFIDRMAKNGQVEDVRQALEYVRKVQEGLPKPIFADRNEVWNNVKVAEDALKTKEEKQQQGVVGVGEYEGANIVNNNDIERVQIFMDEKPGPEVNQALKKEGWNWSPTNNAWQRKNTPAAVRSANDIVKKFYQPKAEAPIETPRETAPQEKPTKELPTTKDQVKFTRGGREWTADVLHVYPDGRVDVDVFGRKTLTPDEYEVVGKTIPTINKAQRESLDSFEARLKSKGGQYIGSHETSAGLVVDYKLAGDKSPRQATIFKDGQMTGGSSGEAKPPTDDKYESFQDTPRRQRQKKLKTEPVTDAPEEIAWDEPLPITIGEDPNFKMSDLNNAMSIRNIARSFVNALGLIEGMDVRSGFIKRFARKARALFNPTSGIIRVKNIRDLRALTHEVGHMIDFELFDMRGIVGAQTRNKNLGPGVDYNGETYSYVSQVERDFKSGKLTRAEANMLIPEVEKWIKARGKEKYADIVDAGRIQGVKFRNKTYKTDAEITKGVSNGTIPAQKGAELITKLNKLNFGRADKLDKLREIYGADVVDGVLQRETFKKELNQLLADIQYPKKERKEAIAEFVYNYVFDRKQVERSTPNFLAWFEKLLDSTPEYKEAFDQLKENFKDYDKQDVLTKAVGEIKTPERDETPWLDGIVNTAGKLYYTTVNHLKYLEDLGKQWESIPIVDHPSYKNPFVSAKELIGIAGKGLQWLTGHPYFKRGNDVVIRKDVKGLLNIIRPIAGKPEYEAYKAYLIALDSIESHNRMKPEQAYFDKETAQTIKRVAEERFGAAKLLEFQGDIQKYNEALLDFYAETGRISQETAQYWKTEHQFYVPLRRVAEAYERMGGKRKVTRDMLPEAERVIFSRKGSEKPLKDIFESMIDNTYSLLASGERNLLLRNVVDAFRDIETYNKANKIEGPILDEIDPRDVSIYQDPVTGEIRYTIAKERAANYKKPKGRIIAVYEEGKPRYYDVAPEYYDPIFQSTSQINYLTQQIVKFASAPSRFLQAGAVVYDPTFPIRNISRDQVSAWFYSKHKYMPTEFIKGIASAIKKDDFYQKWLASGGDQSFLVSANMMLSEDYMSKKVGPLLQKKFTAYRKNPLLALQDFTKLSEIGTRLGAFRSAYKRTGNVNLAAVEARDVAADYGIRGAAMRNILPFFPFLNARMQHARMIAKQFKNPLALMAKGSAIAIPSLLNWWINNRDEESQKLYQSLPTWRRVGLLNIRIPGTDHFFPLPKGFFGVMFGSSVESMLDATLKDDPRVIEDLPNQLFQEISPVGNWSEGIPFPIRPMIEMKVNKKGYTNKPIIPESMKMLAPSEQYFNSTPEIIKKMGEALGWSPLKIEHYVRSYGGGAGIGAVNILDATLQAMGLVERKPEDTFTTLSRMPVFKALLTERPVGLQSGYVSDFYETLDKIEKVNATFNKFVQMENYEALDKFMKDEENKRAYEFYEGNSTAINAFRSALSYARDSGYATMKDETLSAKEKQDQVRQINDVVQESVLRFKEAYENNEFFDYGKAMDEIITKMKAEKKEYRGDLTQQQLTYNPYWMQLREKNTKVYDLLKEYGGLREIEQSRKLSRGLETVDLELEDVRRFNEELVSTYGQNIKNMLGVERRLWEARKSVSDPASPENTMLDTQMRTAWDMAVSETKSKFVPTNYKRKE